MAYRLVPAAPRSRLQIDNLALQLTQKVQPNALNGKVPFDIVRFFECDLEDSTGITIDYQDLQPGIYGYTDTDQLQCVISLSLVEDPSQERFLRSTIAHEVGHALMHVKDYRIKKAILKSIHTHDHQLRAYRAEEIVTFKNPEWQAWRFAGTILMPEQSFRDAIKRGADEKDLADLFNVNPAFIRVRMKALNINLFDKKRAHGQCALFFKRS